MEHAYEIKIRMMNEEMAYKLMAPLGLGKPDLHEASTHTYLKDEECTRKIKDTQGALVYVVARRHGPGFQYTAEPITLAQRTEIELHHPPSVTLPIKRTAWNIEGATVELDTLAQGSVFLELHGSDFEFLKTLARRVGFSEHHYLTRSYDELT